MIYAVTSGVNWYGRDDVLEVPKGILTEEELQTFLAKVLDQHGKEPVMRADPLMPGWIDMLWDDKVLYTFKGFDV